MGGHVTNKVNLIRPAGVAVSRDSGIACPKEPRNGLRVARTRGVRHGPSGHEGQPIANVSRAPERPGTAAPPGHTSTRTPAGIRPPACQMPNSRTSMSLHRVLLAD